MGKRGLEQEGAPGGNAGNRTENSEAKATVFHILNILLAGVAAATESRANREVAETEE